MVVNKHCILQNQNQLHKLQRMLGDLGHVAVEKRISHPQSIKDERPVIVTKWSEEPFSVSPLSEWFADNGQSKLLQLPQTRSIFARSILT